MPKILERLSTFGIFLILLSTANAQEGVAGSACDTTSLYGQVKAGDTKTSSSVDWRAEVTAKKVSNKEMITKEASNGEWYCIKVPMSLNVYLIFSSPGYSSQRSNTIDTTRKYSWPLRLFVMQPISTAGLAEPTIQNIAAQNNNQVVREKLELDKETINPSASNDVFIWNVELYKYTYRNDLSALGEIDQFISELRGDPVYGQFVNGEFEGKSKVYKFVIARNHGLEQGSSVTLPDLLAVINDSGIIPDIRANTISALTSLADLPHDEKDKTVATLLGLLGGDDSAGVRRTAAKALGTIGDQPQVLIALRKAVSEDTSPEVQESAKIAADAVALKFISPPSNVPRSELAYGETRRVDDGEQVKKFRGIVVKRDADWFTMADMNGGPVTVVLLSPSTEVKSQKKGGSQGSRSYEASYILRGLRLEVDGVGNAEGQLVADKIRFDEQDLRTAQALRTTIDPVEAEIRERYRQQQEIQEHLAGQLAESNNIVEANRVEAREANEKAMAAAAEAQRTADLANNRINGLDDFDPIKTVTVNFRTGSAVLTPQAKAAIDEAAAWAKTQNTKGWVMAVVGHADSTGNTARNRDLSERRAQAVIYYIVTKYRTPMHRFVQPFGYGELEPVADNAARAGRAKNRRVEIRLMVNKGIAGQSSSP